MGPLKLEILFARPIEEEAFYLDENMRVMKFIGSDSRQCEVFVCARD
jgi:hypothetical protein